MEKTAREISAKFLPFSNRIYNISGANYSFQDLVRYVRMGLTCAHYRGTQGSTDGGSMDVAMGVTALISDLYDFPFWVIPPGMAEIVSNVRPPEEWDVGAAVFGFPAMYFIMPRNSPLKGDLEERISIISVASLTDEVRERLSVNGIVITKAELMQEAKSALLITAHSECGAIWHLVVPVPESGIINGEVLDALPKYVDVDSHNNTEWLHKKLLPFVATLLGIMSARPETAGTPSVRTKTIKGSSREVWSPRIFGEKYLKAFDGGRGVPTGRHVRTHWRLGHFRQQRYGPGNANIKQILIDAQLVNPPD